MPIQSSHLSIHNHEIKKLEDSKLSYLIVNIITERNVKKLLKLHSVIIRKKKVDMIYLLLFVL